MLRALGPQVAPFIPMALAPVPCLEKVTEPEACEIIEQVRQLSWSRDIALVDAMAPSVLKIGLDTQAQRLLDLGVDTCDNKNPTTPRFVVPMRATLVATTNNSVIPWVVYIPWLPGSKRYVTNMGQLGTFGMEPQVSSNVSHSSSELYHITETSAKFVYQHRYLLGHTIAELEAQQTPEGTVHHVHPTSRLASILRIRDASCPPGPFSVDDAVYKRHMKEIGEDINQLEKLVCSPADMEAHLEPEVPCTQKLGSSLEDILKAHFKKISTNGPDSAKYYTEIEVRIGFKLVLQYAILIPK